MITPLSWTANRKHYWMLPDYCRHFDGGHLLIGPIQFNWGYGGGWRFHITWPVSKSYYFGSKRT